MKIRFLLIFITFLYTNSTILAVTDNFHKQQNSKKSPKILKLEKYCSKNPKSWEGENNLAIEYYQNCNFANSKQHFCEALHKCHEPQHQESIFYNIGNACFRESQNAKSIPERVELLKESLQQYENALALNSQAKDTLHNIEIIKNLLKNIEKQNNNNKGQNKSKNDSENGNKQQNKDDTGNGNNDENNVNNKNSKNQSDENNNNKGQNKSKNDSENGNKQQNKDDTGNGNNDENNVNNKNSKNQSDEKDNNKPNLPNNSFNTNSNQANGNNAAINNNSSFDIERQEMENILNRAKKDEKMMPIKFFKTQKTPYVLENW